jgi:hypothetical protein
MALELDHLFIFTTRAPQIADRLTAFGLTEGTPNTHPGQGTSNRRFFFHNTMLELLWVDDLPAAQSEAIHRTRLGDRWLHLSTSCPFGICFRPTPGPELNLPTWAYHPPYLPPTVSINIATNSDNLTEPFLFILPFAQRPDQLPPEKTQPIDHPLGLREITRLHLHSPTKHPTPELQTLIDHNLIQLSPAQHHCIELGFDNETQGQQIDLQSELPLIISW